MSGVQQVRRSEHALAALISQDADLTVEALSNLPEDARGRLQTLLTLSQEVADQAATGHLVVMDTGLGEATYTLLESGEESATTDDADTEQPASQTVLAHSSGPAYSGPANQDPPVVSPLPPQPAQLPLQPSPGP